MELGWKGLKYFRPLKAVYVLVGWNAVMAVNANSLFCLLATFISGRTSLVLNGQIIAMLESGPV